MNKIASKILTDAYTHYLNASTPHCTTMLSGSGTNISSEYNAIKYLEQDGYIENIVQNGLFISFDISPQGIEYMRLNRGT